MLLKCNFSAFRKVQQLQFAGEVDMIIIFWYQVFPGSYLTKNYQNRLMFHDVIQKIKGKLRGTFYGTAMFYLFPIRWEEEAALTWEVTVAWSGRQCNVSTTQLLQLPLSCDVSGAFLQFWHNIYSAFLESFNTIRWATGRASRLIWRDHRKIDLLKKNTNWK